MSKIDPIIAVTDDEGSSKWYQSIFGYMRIHECNQFGVLVSKNDEVLLCLHKWGDTDTPL